LKDNFQKKVFADFIKMDKEATNSFQSVQRSLKKENKSNTVPSRKRRHFSQNKSPKV